MARRALAVLRGLATAAVFALALGCGLALHLGMPAVRRALFAEVERALASAFLGKVIIGNVGALGASGVDGFEASVQDPDGRTVLTVEGGRARISALATVLSLLRAGDVSVDLTELSAGRVDVDIDTDDDGVPRIARAVAPRSPPSGAPGRGVRLVLGDVRVDRVRVHGKASGAPAVDMEIADVAGSLRLASGALTVDVTRTRLSGAALPGGAKATGTLSGHLAVPSPRGAAVGLTASWTGVVGAVHETASLDLDGGQLGAAVDAPHVLPEEIRSLWPACPFTAPASLHAEAQGTLPQLTFQGHGAVGSSAVKADGHLTLGAGFQATAHLIASSVDLRAFEASAPASEIAATADASVNVPAAGATTAEVLADVAASTVAGDSLPPAKVHLKGTLDPSQPNSMRATATVDLREPGAPTSLTLRLAPQGSSYALAFEARAVVPSLEDAPRLGRVAEGEAAAAVAGSLDVASGRFEANGQVTTRAVRAGGASLEDLTLVVHASGPLGSPRFDATLEGGPAELGPLHFQHLRARSQGGAAGAQLELRLAGRAADLSARAMAEFTPKPSLRDVTLTFERAGHRAVARAAYVSFGGDEARIDDAEIEGIGAPVHAALRQSPSALYVRAHSRNLDLARLAGFLGVEDASGRVAVDVDALLRKNGAQGRVQFDVHDATLAGIGKIEAHLGATLDDRHLAGAFAATVGDIGSVEAHSTSLQIGGSDPPSWSYWKRAWGTADGTAHVDLAKLAAHLPAGTLGPAPPSGVVDLSAQFERDSAADATPGVDVSAQTKGLALGGKDADWHIQGIDAAVRVKVDGESGHTAIDAQLGDAGGVLAKLSATSDGVLYGDLFAGRDGFDTLRGTPFEAELTVPTRRIETLPALLGMQKERGLLEADVRWKGTASEPSVDFTASVHQGQANVRVLALPLEVGLAGHYDGAHVGARVQASGRGRPLLDAGVTVDARAADVLAWLRGAPLAWTASSRAKITGFPLQSIGAFDDRGIRGRLNGTLVLDGLHGEPRATLSASVDGLKVGDLAYKSAQVSATVGNAATDAAVRLDQDDGFLEAHARIGTRWGDAVVPSVESSQPIEVSLSAKQYRLGLLAPLLSTYVSELDGRVTASARIRIDPAAQTIVPEGTISLQDGAFELTALGGAFHDVSGRVTMTPDGVVRIEDVSARGVSGRLEAAATARVDGRGMSGLRGRIQVPQKEQLPVVFDDVQVGSFYGALSVAADRSPDARSLDVNVGVESLHVTLPASPGHDVQGLGGIEGLRMTRRGRAAAGEQARDATQATETAQAVAASVRINVDLGKDAEVKRGTTLDVVLEGRPTVLIGAQVRASGQVLLPRGSIDVQGKEFTIESGTVTFLGDDPTNPQVDLTAKWQAPDDTVVYADFRGPLKTGQVTLRSEPSRTKNEIIALILFGSTEDASTASSSDTSGAQGLSVVGGAAGGAATQPINRVLDSFGLAGGVRTKIDTSSTTPRPEVEVQIARDITLQVAWVLGVPPPGSNPDTTLVSLNWRFLRQWSLQTKVGDAGTSIVDLIWQHRY